MFKKKYIFEPTILDYCRTPGRKMGICLSIYDCGYLLDILQSNTLTQQSIQFLRQSQCVPEEDGNPTPHVCCSRNDDNLTLQSNMNKTHLPALSAVFTNVTITEEGENVDASTASSNFFLTMLPNRTVCGKETVENRIYSGQVI